MDDLQHNYFEHSRKKSAALIAQKHNKQFYKHNGHKPIVMGTTITS